jgi:hypothetical protein
MDPTLRQKMHLSGCSHLLEPGHASGSSPQSPAIDPRYAFGISTAATVLPALGVTFQELRQTVHRLAKPILDVGASYSTVACEAHLRGIPVFSTDLGCDKNRPVFLENVARNLRTCKDLYISGGHSSDNYCSPIPATLWERRVEEAIAFLDRHLTQCPASDIRMPGGWQANDRHFAVVYSHHAVPQYSSVESFLKEDLPELLRVTAHTLVLHPFQIGGSSLQPAHEGDAAFLQAVASRAKRAGFTFELIESPSEHFPEARTARFTAFG